MTVTREELDALQANWGRFVDDPWPSGLLLLRKSLQAGLSRRELARRLGTGTHGQGCALLDRLVGGPNIPFDPPHQLIGILGISAEEIATAEAADRAIARDRGDAEERRRETAARASFRPHAWVIPERRIPSPVFAAAILGQDTFLRVDLPEGIAALPPAEQLRLVGDAVRAHYRERRGDTLVFGRILGYLYRRTFDETVELTVEGDIVGATRRHPVGGRASVRVGNKELANGGDRR